jgi:glucokinase
VPEAVAIGIDVGGTKLVAATLAADGGVLRRLRRETPAGDERQLVGDLGDLVAELGSDLPVGVGIAGLVTPKGAVRYSPNIAVYDLDLAAELGQVTSGGVAIVNDASAAARGHHDVVMLTLGTGVGGGVVVAGELVLGTQGYAGELGHLIVEEGGRPCPCGNRGCIEAYASGSAIGRAAAQRLATTDAPGALRDVDPLTGKSVTLAAREDDELAREVIEEAGFWLGVALAGLVNALDPEIVLLGGGAAAETAPWMVPAASAAMRQRLLGPDFREIPPIELASLGDDAGMVGAGLLAAERAGTI